MKLRVLVIDDDEDICLYLREFLTREGFKVTTISKPADALVEIRQGRHQIVLLDVRMPGVDGVDLLRQVRAVDSDICVIVMTGYPSVQSAVDSMKASAFDYLQKPFDLQSLRTVMDRTLTLRQLANKTALSVSLISQNELGKSAASVATLRKLATALGVSLSGLF